MQTLRSFNSNIATFVKLVIYSHSHEDHFKAIVDHRKIVMILQTGSSSYEARIVADCENHHAGTVSGAHLCTRDGAEFLGKLLAYNLHV